MDERRHNDPFLSNGLSRKQSIRGRKFFKKIFDKGFFIRGFLLNFWVYQGPETAGNPAPLLGLMVGKKVYSRATQRNLWKRRVREVFRRNQCKIEKHVAMIVQARAHKQVPNCEDLQLELEKFLKKIESRQ